MGVGTRGETLKSLTVLGYKLGTFRAASQADSASDKRGAPPSLPGLTPGASLVHPSAQGGGRWLLQRLGVSTACTSTLPSPSSTWQVGPAVWDSAVTPGHISNRNASSGTPKSSTIRKTPPQMSIESRMEKKLWGVRILERHAARASKS